MLYREGGRKPKRTLRYRNGKMRFNEPEEEYSGPIYNDGMLDEVTVTGDKYKEKRFTPANLATFGLLNKAKRRLTRNIEPYSYSDTEQRVYNAIFNPDRAIDIDGETITTAGDKAKTLSRLQAGDGPSRWKTSAAFADADRDAYELGERQQLFQYMMGQDAGSFNGIPLSGDNYGIRTSKYKPSTAKNPDAQYFMSPVTESRLKHRINYMQNMMLENDMDPRDALTPGSGRSTIQAGPGEAADISAYGGVLGNMTVTKGEDEKGKYISYYDKWDLEPYSGYEGTDEKIEVPSTIPILGGKKISGDKVHRLTNKLQEAAGVKPAEIYGRIYYNENPDGTITFVDDEEAKQKKYRSEIKKDK